MQLRMRITGVEQRVDAFTGCFEKVYDQFAYVAAEKMQLKSYLHPERPANVDNSR